MLHTSGAAGLVDRQPVIDASPIEDIDVLLGGHQAADADVEQQVDEIEWSNRARYRAHDTRPSGTPPHSNMHVGLTLSEHSTPETEYSGAEVKLSDYAIDQSRDPQPSVVHVESLPEDIDGLQKVFETEWHEVADIQSQNPSPRVGLGELGAAEAEPCVLETESDNLARDQSQDPPPPALHVEPNMDIDSLLGPRADGQEYHVDKDWRDCAGHRGQDPPPSAARAEPNVDSNILLGGHHAADLEPRVLDIERQCFVGHQVQGTPLCGTPVELKDDIDILLGEHHGAKAEHKATATKPTGFVGRQTRHLWLRGAQFDSLVEDIDIVLGGQHAAVSEHSVAETEVGDCTGSWTQGSQPDGLLLEPVIEDSDFLPGQHRATKAEHIETERGGCARRRVQIPRSRGCMPSESPLEDIDFLLGEHRATKSEHIETEQSNRAGSKVTSGSSSAGHYIAPSRHCTAAPF